MSLPEQSPHAYHEADISQAISEYHSGKHTSLRQAADAFSIPCTTLQRRVAEDPSPALVVEMADEIRRGRLQLAKGSDLSPRGPEYMDKTKSTAPGTMLRMRKM
ncbi:hypothetical protein LTS02_010799 [Friedmanniomyces endolithicus]|nr:hypothetical protein LTR59_017972 [Friedmanniomyces endolithicus]KAK0769209.1 hypothetical protein LTR38_017942 [Friedmanniomyces endolithicus]KAK0823564.1 hypothetical protein LTR03_017915 [Friedmanniomyces endolithicus]KAK0855998.1 hypothetical protein LTS02_010799 [Friedmanniomyces endolithicus]